MKRYKVSLPRLLGLLACLLVYGAISLYGSVGLGNNVAMGVCIQLGLGVVTFVLVLFALWKPFQKGE